MNTQSKGKRIMSTVYNICETMTLYASRLEDTIEQLKKENKKLKERIEQLEHLEHQNKACVVYDAYGEILCKEQLEENQNAYKV